LSSLAAAYGALDADIATVWALTQRVGLSLIFVRTILLDLSPKAHGRSRRLLQPRWESRSMARGGSRNEFPHQRVVNHRERESNESPIR
jgi:hypothetical protein